MAKSSFNRCPHCHAKARISTSRHVSEISRETYFQCTNIECGHTWKSVTTAILTIVPSRNPNPKVHIPLSEKVNAMMAIPSAEPTG